MDPDGWASALASACREFGITTALRESAFVANVIHECGAFTELAENMNYSVAALTLTFGVSRISASQAAQLGRTPTRAADQPGIANQVYGGSWGVRNLGNTEPGDGWLFRGHGPMQTTGRANHAAIGKLVGIEVEHVPAYVMTQTGGARSAAAFWSSHKCNLPADRGDIAAVRRIINGGEIGLSEVTKLYQQALSVW